MKRLNLRSMRTRLMLLALLTVLFVLIVSMLVTRGNVRELLREEIALEADAALTQAAMYVEYLQESVNMLAVQIASDAMLQHIEHTEGTFARFRQQEAISNLLRAYKTRTNYVLGIEVTYNDGRKFDTTTQTHGDISIREGTLDSLLTDERNSAFSGMLYIDYEGFTNVPVIAYMLRFSSYVLNEIDYATLVIYVKAEHFIRNLQGSFPMAARLALRDGDGMAIYEEGGAAEGGMSLTKPLIFGWSLEASFIDGQLEKRYNAILNALLVVSLFIAAATLLVILPMIRRWTEPIRQLTAFTEEVARGNLDVQMVDAPDDEIGQLALAFTRMTEHLKQYIDQQIQEEKERNRLQTELQMARINPHFIYNTLDSVIWLARMGNTQEMIRLCRVFIAILQDTMYIDNEYAATTLAREIEIVRDYEEIQSMRYAGRFAVEYRLDPLAEQAVVPKLLLQPIVENALYHGILPDESRIGHITITTRAEGNLAVVEIVDDGMGISQEVLVRLNRPDYMGEKSQLHSIGLSNLRRRLELMYPGRYVFHFSSEPGQGTYITIKVPNEANIKGVNSDEEKDQ